MPSRLRATELQAPGWFQRSGQILRGGQGLQASSGCCQNTGIAANLPLCTRNTRFPDAAIPHSPLPSRA